MCFPTSSKRTIVTRKTLKRGKPVSEKKVENESSPGVLSEGITPKVRVSEEMCCKVLVKNLSTAFDRFFQSIFGLHPKKKMGVLTIRCDAMFKAVELPAGVADLDSGLPDVDGEALPHYVKTWLNWGARLVQGAPRTRD